MVTPSEPQEPTTPTEPTTPSEPTTENPAKDNARGNISDDSSGGSTSIFIILLVGILRMIRQSTTKSNVSSQC